MKFQKKYLYSISISYISYERYAQSLKHLDVGFGGAASNCIVPLSGNKPRTRRKLVRCWLSACGKDNVHAAWAYKTLQSEIPARQHYMQWPN